jgi:hypothetical protein
MTAGIRFPTVGLPGSAEELRAEVREFLSCEITAGKAAAIAHQVHGAIGFTERHPLHESTRRRWAWRDELGAQSEWAERLGSIIGGCGPDNLWPILTARRRSGRWPLRHGPTRRGA